MIAITVGAVHKLVGQRAPSEALMLAATIAAGIACDHGGRAMAQSSMRG